MKMIIEAIGWATILVLATILVRKLIASTRAKPRLPEKNTFASRLELQKALMSELIKACGGNKPTAMRLIERERKLEPSLKTLEAIDRAIAKLARDRGGYSKSR
jgi:hypothetical protein